jgi:hypothetical protein
MKLGSIFVRIVACLVEDNEHMLMFKDTKAQFYQSRRLTALTTGMFKKHSGREVQLKHFMQDQPGSGPFQLTFLNHVPEPTKGPISEAVEQRNRLGANTYSKRLFE